jgi:Alpha/beta hydrolase domain
MQRPSSLRQAFFAAAVGLAAALLGVGMAGAQAFPAVVAVPGKPSFLMGAYDLGALGYEESEYFLSGTATAYQLPGPPTPDGRWTVNPAATAPYATRLIVIRPTDPSKFNGTVLVEWLNVTAGQDTPADWMVAHREMIRKGYAYVGVSAQKVGVEGGGAIMGSAGVSLKKADPARYGTLDHPGDAFSYDIFSQAGAAVKAPGASGLLSLLKPQRVLAIGESQSAAFLTTYVDAIDPVAKVYDGVMIHSRFGSGAALDGTRMDSGASAMPPAVRFRPDLRVPLLVVITETDMLGGRLPGYHAAQQPDTDHLRVWEIAGTAHADNYLFGGAFIDSGLEPTAALAHIFIPNANTPAGKIDKPGNPGMPHHYVVEAALASLDRWVRTGAPPVSAPKLVLATGGKVGVDPSLALDANGLAQGGVRTPWVEVPTIRLSGAGNSGSFLAVLVGLGEPFDQAALARLYPGGKAEYLKRFEASLSAAIKAGYILPEDRREILAIAAMNYGGPN